MPDRAVDPLTAEMLDGGPRYVETPSNVTDFPGWFAEPWNTGSAMLFVVIPMAWALILRGRYRDHPFLTMCLPVLAVGGIGGVLYHGLRSAVFFRFLDAVPIYILGLGVAIWIWVRLGPKLRNLLVLIGLLGFMQLLAFASLPRDWAVNLFYACL